MYNVLRMSEVSQYLMTFAPAVFVETVVQEVLFHGEGGGLTQRTELQELGATVPKIIASQRDLGVKNTECSGL